VSSAAACAHRRSRDPSRAPGCSLKRLVDVPPDDRDLADGNHQPAQPTRVNVRVNARCGLTSVTSSQSHASYRTAIGLNGDPVPPGSLSGSADHESHRFSSSQANARLEVEAV